jgi:hypothetical protein
MLLKNSLWRSSTIITPRFGGSNTHQNKGKSPMPQPTSKRHQRDVYGQNNSGSYGSFGASGSKGIPRTEGSWRHLKDAKAEFKGSSKSTTFDKHFKRERSTSSKNYDSWNKAKKRSSTDEINIRRNTCACMNCGVVGHVFNGCSKPKP